MSENSTQTGSTCFIWYWIITTRFFANLFWGLWIIFVNKVIIFSQFKILIQRVASALKNETKNTVKYTEQEYVIDKGPHPSTKHHLKKIVREQYK